jgi:hypothetical protein
MAELPLGFVAPTPINGETHDRYLTRVVHALEGWVNEFITNIRAGRLPASQEEVALANEASIENEIQAKGLNAPRLTPAQIDDTIIGTDYHVFPGTTLTVCALTLRNGFIVTGESAAASPENFDVDIGKKIARDNARQKIWALEGYLLRERLAATSTEACGSPSARRGQFRKKPVVIDAVQYYGIENVDGSPDAMFDGLFSGPEWLEDAQAKNEGDPGSVWIDFNSTPPSLMIGTLEGNHRADPSDYIIRGIKGEIYPCKPDIFAATYDPA